ncbi:hypothetical protein [Staphylococcus haemolyticus]|nr:hypothetical protein [Staphylococcus haemolyticus]
MIDIEEKAVLFQFLQSSERDSMEDRVFIYRPLKRTIIESTIFLNRDDFKRLKREANSGSMNTSEISNLFDFQLKVLNNLIESTIIKFNHYNLYSLNKGELSSVPFYKTYTFYADTCTEFNHGAIFLDYFKGLEINENATLDNKKFFHINQYYEDYKIFPNKHSVLLLGDAQRNFDLCDYNSTIINAQTSVETFIKFIVENYYIYDKNLSKDDAKNKTSKFKNSIYDHLFPKVIDGLNLPSGEALKNCLNIYYYDYYDFRNEIVHNGYNASEKEAKDFLTTILDIYTLISYGLNNTGVSSNFVNYYKSHYFSSSGTSINGVANKYL